MVKSGFGIAENEFTMKIMKVPYRHINSATKGM